MVGDDEVVADGSRVRYSLDRFAPLSGGVTAASAAGPSEDGVPSSTPSNPVGVRGLRRVRRPWPSASAKPDSTATAGARLTAQRDNAPCVRRIQVERSRTETAIRGAGERTERTEIQSGEHLGVTVRQITSPSAPLEGAPDPRQRSRVLVLIAGAVVLVAAVVTAAVLLLGREQGSESSAASDPGPSFTIAPASPTTIDPQEAVRTAVIRDYLASHAAYDEATGAPDGRPPNPDLPGLDRYMVGDQLIQVRRYIIGMKAGGLTSLGPPAQLRPRVASLQGTTAIVHDCYTTDGHIVDARTHALRDPAGSTTMGLESTLQLDAASGVWKVAKSVRKPELCAAS